MIIVHPTSDTILRPPRILALALLLGIFPSIVAAEDHDVGAAERMLPMPVKIEAGVGGFRIDAGTVLVAPAAWQEEATTLAADLRALTGLPFPVRESSDGPAIRLAIDTEPARQSPEGYRLRVGSDGVEITAAAAAGVFYGGRTLMQLLPPAAGKEALVIAAVAIEDHPRFAWRGLMLDCSRTLQSVDYLKATLNRMAVFKLNVLHLHLTDDQGWRIEIKKHPELTRKGALFSASFKEPPSHEGFYTQEQLKGVLAYAATRHITVVPEIEMPGHSHEVMVSRPDLTCAGRTSPEVFPFYKGPTTTSDVFCAGNEDVFRFLEDVLDEVTAVFPSTFIHVGGDEVPKTAWKSCPKCQARMKAEGLENEHALQSYFIRRIEKVLSAKGRRLVGWDEILEGGLAPNATVMSWRGVSGGIAAAKAGHDVVMSPTSHCYFDYDYAAINSQRVFSFDPLAGLEPQAARRVLGVQANFWSHIDREPELVDRQLFPRLMALAERGWSPDNRADWPGFSIRARAQLPRLERMGVHFQTSDLPTSRKSNQP